MEAVLNALVDKQPMKLFLMLLKDKKKEIYLDIKYKHVNHIHTVLFVVISLIINSIELFHRNLHISKIWSSGKCFISYHGKPVIIKDAVIGRNKPIRPSTNNRSYLFLFEGIISSDFQEQA